MFTKVIASEQSAEGLPVIVLVPVVVPVILPVMFPVIGEAVLAVGQWLRVSPAMFAKVIASGQSAEVLPVIVPVTVGR